MSGAHNWNAPVSLTSKPKGARKQAADARLEQYKKVILSTLNPEMSGNRNLLLQKGLQGISTTRSAKSSTAARRARLQKEMAMAASQLMAGSEAATPPNNVSHFPLAPPQLHVPPQSSQHHMPPQHHVPVISAHLQLATHATATSKLEANGSAPDLSLHLVNLETQLKLFSHQLASMAATSSKPIKSEELPKASHDRDASKQSMSLPHHMTASSSEIAHSTSACIHGPVPHVDLAKLHLQQMAELNRLQQLQCLERLQALQHSLVVRPNETVATAKVQTSTVKIQLRPVQTQGLANQSQSEAAAALLQLAPCV